MLPIFLELLDEERKQVFTKLAVFKKEGILSGGTALSLQIGHRLSYDFDIFWSGQVTAADRRLVKESLNIKRIDLDTPDQLDVLTESGVKLTLLYYPYKNLFPLVETSSLALASVKDIALDKAVTIGRRAVWRDYVDMFFILKSGTSIYEIVDLSLKKFGVEFNPKLFLEQLCYFNDLEIAPISYVSQKPASAEIQNFLTEQVKHFKDQKIIS